MYLRWNYPHHEKQLDLPDTTARSPRLGAPRHRRPLRRPAGRHGLQMGLPLRQRRRHDDPRLVPDPRPPLHARNRRPRRKPRLPHRHAATRLRSVDHAPAAAYAGGEYRPRTLRTHGRGGDPRSDRAARLHRGQPARQRMEQDQADAPIAACRRSATPAGSARESTRERSAPPRYGGRRARPGVSPRAPDARR